ncbi:MAG TPA: FkbM family methyltransferase [Bacteroides sp.]|nr:FkbM family methyltransferase [Bacteroides sp.]
MKLSKFEIARILWSVKIKKRLFRSRKEITQKIFGYKVSAYSYRSFRILFREVFLDHEYHFISENHKPYIIDCGANIGMAVIYFKMLYPDSHIIAFEPSPHAFKMLEKNVTQNNLKNVTIVNSALSDHEGKMSFYMDQSKDSLSSSLNPERGGSDEVSVNVEKLSSYISDRNFDLIKIDVEGGEWGIVEDLIQSKMIKNTKKYLVEYHHRIRPSSNRFAKFLQYFEENGFTYNLKTRYNNIGDFHDIFLHFYMETDS